LHVNVDHVATLRNARGTHYPDPVLAAEECLAAGADGITAHLREDRRHIVDADILRLRTVVARAKRTFNLEMAPTEEMVGIALSVRPDLCTLVPERREERTTEGGLDVAGAGSEVASRIHKLTASGIRVSLFVAPEERQIRAARALGGAQVELHTGEYAHGREGELGRLAEGARCAAATGLEVAAGHGLTRDNVLAVARLPAMVELNIGHALICDALFLGMRGAVKAYREAIAAAQPQSARGLTGAPER
jgi:pyridoxine 5-phosphate synthase